MYDEIILVEQKEREREENWSDRREREMIRRNADVTRRRKKKKERERKKREAELREGRWPQTLDYDLSSHFKSPRFQRPPAHPSH
ncbi:hypothetical protein ANTQUA_LOCUS7989 [Anthophora quadrimaculata]